MAREIIPRFTDKTVNSFAPIDEDASPRNPLDNTTDGATCSFKVFDPAKDEVISVAEASGQTVLSVTNAGVFAVSDSVEVTLDNGTLFPSTISSIDTVSDPTTVTLADAITDTAAANNRIRVILGSSISMAEFGTPDLNTTDWGFRATLPDDHPAHLDPQSKTGFDVNIEVTLIGGPGLQKRDTICATISEQDCS